MILIKGPEMFKTNRKSELFPGRSNGSDDVQFWSFIEQDAAWPWFYLQLVEEDGGELFRSMLMVPTPVQLEQVVAVKDDHAWIEQAQLVTPSHINDTERWTMEPLLEVSLILDDQGLELGYRYRVEGGREYSVSVDPFPDGQLKTHIIFSAAWHIRAEGY